MPEHAEDIAENDIVIFVDAEESASYGNLKCTKINAEDMRDTGTSSHDYTLESILLMTMQLFGKLPEIYLITVCGKSFLTSDRLSPEVEKRIPDIIDTIFSIINRKKHLSVLPLIL